MGLRSRPSPIRRRAIRALALACGIAVVPASVGLADTLRLKDGNVYHGQVHKTEDGWVITFEDGNSLTFATAKVAGVDADPRNQVAAERLASLRRAVPAIDDPRRIMERYRAFIQQFAGTTAAADAREDLSIWQDRLDRKLIKVGDQWVTEPERHTLIEASLLMAEQAMQLLRQGKVNEALPVLDKAISDNADNAPAWYLKGLVLWKQDHIPEARKAFERVVELMPDHAPTHNNLAVLLWRQNQHVAALLSYDKALLASPQNRLILDNLAEAFAALPVELRARTTVGRVVRHFNDDDAIVRERLAEQGLFRWGSSWVTKPEYSRLVEIEKEVRGRLDQMEIEYNGQADKVRQLDAEIASTESTIRRMEANSAGVDAYGRIVRYALPPSYYDFIRDLGTLRAERQQRVDEQALMRKQAQQLAQSLPTPRYSGAQRMVEFDGTPIFGPKVVAEQLAARQQKAEAQPAGNAAIPPAGAPQAAGQPSIAPPGGAQPANPPAAATPSTPSAPAAPTPSSPVAPAAEPATRPVRPAPTVPPEKPSILDRRFRDALPPPLPDRPIYDEAEK